MNSSSCVGETQMTRAGPPMHNMAELGMVSKALSIEVIGQCSHLAIILNHAAAFVITAVYRPQTAGAAQKGLVFECSCSCGVDWNIQCELITATPKLEQEYVG